MAEVFPVMAVSLEPVSLILTDYSTALNELNRVQRLRRSHSCAKLQLSEMANAEIVKANVPSVGLKVRSFPPAVFH